MVDLFTTLTERVFLYCQMPTSSFEGGGHFTGMPMVANGCRREGGRGQKSWNVKICRRPLDLNNQKNLWLPSIFQFERKVGFLNHPNHSLCKSFKQLTLVELDWHLKLNFKYFAYRIFVKHEAFNSTTAICVYI